MQKLKDSWWIGPVLSGILSFVAIAQINFLVSWICYIPLFVALANTTPNKVFKQGLVFGFVFSVFAFFWMIPGAERFTGSSILYGLIVFIFSAAFISVFYALLLYCFAVLKNKNRWTKSILVQSLLIAAVFSIGEALLTMVSENLPWFDVHSGNGLTANLYAVQPASLFGIHILTFIVVVVNFLTAQIISQRRYKRLYIPATILVIYLFGGWFMLQSFDNDLKEGKPFNVAILAENIPPDVKWDEQNGNMLAQRLLDLNKSAITQKPDVILWSESAIPWTYRKDDELVNTVLSITNPGNATHVMGINTEYKGNEVFNSAYCILPGGKVTSRYDKQFLLGFIEKPLIGMVMPFFSSSGFIAKTDNDHAAPLNTPYGKAGILICNEAAVAKASSVMVQKGAQFLFNISNDGWFNDTYIVRLHYYYARLRAVESRKDIAINSNNGYSGMISASGAIVQKQRSEDPFVQVVSIQPNNNITMASVYPDLFVYCCAGFVFLVLLVQLLVGKKAAVRTARYSFKV